VQTGSLPKRNSIIEGLDAIINYPIFIKTVNKFGLCHSFLNLSDTVAEHVKPVAHNAYFPAGLLAI